MSVFTRHSFFDLVKATLAILSSLSLLVPLSDVNNYQSKNLSGIARDGKINNQDRCRSQYDGHARLTTRQTRVPTAVNTPVKTRPF